MNDHATDDHSNNNETTRVFRSAVLALLDELFDTHHGMVLDEGTSLLPTLSSLSAEQASRAIVGGGASIAAHADHIRYYLDVLEAFVQGRKFGPVDWGEIWRTVNTVTDDEWMGIQARLMESYGRVKTMVMEKESWGGEREIGGAIGIVVHTAYHLGAIRQMIKVVGS